MSGGVMTQRLQAPELGLRRIAIVLLVSALALRRLTYARCPLLAGSGRLARVEGQLIVLRFSIGGEESHGALHSSLAMLSSSIGTSAQIIL